MEKKTKRRHKHKKIHPDTPSGGPKPSKFQRKLSRFGRKLAKLLPSFPQGPGKRAEAPSRAASKSGARRIPRLALLLPLLVAGAALAVFLRSCNSSQVVIEESEETIRVRQMMNEVLQQQQQQSGP